MKQATLPLVLMTILLAASMSPAISADTTSRSTPDMTIASFTLSNAGSISQNGTVIAEDATHVVRIQVRNIGVSAGQATVALLLQGTPSSGDLVIDTANVGVVNAGGVSSTAIFSWNAVLGDGQILKAEVTSSGDSNSANDQDQMIVDVQQYQNVTVPVVNIPQPSSGETSVVWSQAVQDFSVGVRNDGVKAFSAQFTLAFTNVNTPSDTFTATSETLTAVQPGNLYNGSANPQTIDFGTTPFDSSSRSGTYTVVGTLTASGPGWSDTVEFLSQTVLFSAYDFELVAPHTLSVEPGQTASLTYLIRNVGQNSDDYMVSQSNVSGWVTSTTPASGTSTPTITPNITSSILVQVSVPADALRTESETVTLTITSNGGSYAKVLTTTVLTGPSYEANVTMASTNPATKLLMPGASGTIQVVVQNDGNVPSSFSLATGISTNPQNWVVSLSSATTGTLAVGENVTVTVTLSPPMIKNPLVPAEYNRAGDSMSVWVQAQPQSGGIPAVAAQSLSIGSVIVVDPGLPSTTIDMTPQQVRLAAQGVALNEVLNLDLEVRHNLASDLDEEVDVALSLGTPVFVPDSSGGFAETGRWALGLSPTLFPEMSLGDEESAVMTIQGPADEYPVAGTLTVPIVSNVSLGSVHQGSGVVAAEIEQTLTINVPAVHDIGPYDSGTLDAMVGERTLFPINVSNTGNDMASYRLSIGDSLPDNWLASFSNTTLMPTTTVVNLPADVADYPSAALAHVASVDLSIQTAQDAPANSVETLTITVEDMNSGAPIGEFDVPIRVGEQVNASLSPSSQLLNMSLGDTITTSVVISNVGNTPATFNIWLDQSSAGAVTFQLESPSVVQIGAGYESTVRVRIQPTADALAAEYYAGTVWVSNTASGLNLSANIISNISEQHGININTITDIGVVPGTSEVVNFSLLNNGNLVEDVVIVTTVQNNWTVTPERRSANIGVGDYFNETFTVDVPALGGSDELLDGSIYAVTIQILNATTSEVLNIHQLNLIVAPVFMVEVSDWPSEMFYYRGFERTWDASITNTGNKDVNVSVNYTIFQGGLTTLSSDWEVRPGSSPSRLFLPMGETVSFTFAVRGVATQPALTLAANLVVGVSPLDPEVIGNAEFVTTLRMGRFFELGDTDVTPPQGGGAEAYPITYSHIPIGAISAVAYEVELCSANRLLDFNALQQNASLYEWSFIMRVGDTDYPLDLTQFCGATSLGPSSRISLPSRQPWVTDQPIQLLIDSPDPPNVLAGDGWDLTLRLYHPDEHNGYTVYDEETFTYRLAVFSDPAIIQEGSGPTSDAFYEGVETTYNVEVQNLGTAIALGVDVELDCGEAVDVLNNPEPVGMMQSSDSHTFVFDVRPSVIDWWLEAQQVNCTAQITYFSTGDDDGNVEANDVLITDDLEEPLLVRSLSPDVSIAFVATVVAFLLSLIFGRLSGQSEKWRLSGIYAGLLGFGFAFHLFAIPYWGIGVLALAVLWLWRMSWKSSEEFRMIHEDYQRARKGISTVYTDHFDALKDGRRQLTIILSMPILGLLAVVLGLPPQLEATTDNLVVLLAYFLVSAIGVWFLLRRADAAYGNLYGRMTDAEIKAIRLERDLGDPARLLNDLADEGLDLSAVLGQAAPPSTPAPVALGVDEGDEGEPTHKETIDESLFIESQEVSPDV